MEIRVSTINASMNMYPRKESERQRAVKKEKEAIKFSEIMKLYKNSAQNVG